MSCTRCPCLWLMVSFRVQANQKNASIDQNVGRSPTLPQRNVLFLSGSSIIPCRGCLQLRSTECLLFIQCHQGDRRCSSPLECRQIHVAFRTGKREPEPSVPRHAYDSLVDYFQSSLWPVSCDGRPVYSANARGH
ncbi:hypothetical protein QBC39DRAFT_136176 [Podospora conica]|nr:hypothetical protein QBC39DRAFT_136176 [Schizothecium conicum]